MCYFVTNKKQIMETYIGKNIKLFREKSGVSQTDVADYCGIKREILSYYENEKREVSLLHLEKIAEFLSVDMRAFLEENPSEIQPDYALAFRANELTPSDRDQIAYFKRIVKNYLKMKTIELNGIQA
jgi:transcriptional regulator with XRE-family HTH domain